MSDASTDPTMTDTSTVDISETLSESEELRRELEDLIADNPITNEMLTRPSVISSERKTSIVEEVLKQYGKEKITEELTFGQILSHFIQFMPLSSDDPKFIVDEENFKHILDLMVAIFTRKNLWHLSAAFNDIRDDLEYTEVHKEHDDYVRTRLAYECDIEGFHAVLSLLGNRKKANPIVCLVGQVMLYELKLSVQHRASGQRKPYDARLNDECLALIMLELYDVDWTTFVTEEDIAYWNHHLELSERNYHLTLYLDKAFFPHIAIEPAFKLIDITVFQHTINAAFAPCDELHPGAHILLDSFKPIQQHLIGKLQQDWSFEMRFVFESLAGIEPGVPLTALYQPIWREEEGDTASEFSYDSSDSDSLASDTPH